MSKHAEIIKRANSLNELRQVGKDLNLVEAGMTEDEKREIAETYTERYEQMTRPPEPITNKELYLQIGSFVIAILVWYFTWY